MIVFEFPALRASLLVQQGSIVFLRLTAPDSRRHYAMQRSLALFVFTICTCRSVNLPPTFEKCNRHQADFKECVLRAAQNGFKQLTRPFDAVGLPSLDPLALVELPVGTQKEIVAIDQTNCKFYGFDKTVLDKFEFDFEAKRLYFSGVVPEVRKYCDYLLNGKILLLPINATIPTTITISKMAVTFSMPFEEVKRNNKTYFEFHDTKVTLDPGHMVFHLANLLNGIENFTELINNKFNEDWRAVFTEFKEEYERESGAIAENIINRFFSKISIEEAFD